MEKQQLLLCTVPQLKEKCKAAGLKTTGTKTELIGFLLAPSSGAKRKRASEASEGGGQRGGKRPGSGGSGEEEEARLVATLSRRAPSRKEIESTEAGGAPTVVERTLPSFFDFYPRAKRAYDALRPGDAGARLRLLRACESVVATGDATEMGRLVGAALAGEAGDASAPIDVDDDAAAAESASFRWQVDGGDAGWLDFDARSNEIAERARRGGAEVTTFTSPYGEYTLNLSFMVQINKHTGTARPVRFVA